MTANIDGMPEAQPDVSTYLADVQVRRAGGPVKLVRLPGEADDVTMGSHPGIAPHIGADPELPPSASTLDYIVGATAACLAGTFARTLAARDITLPAEDHEIVAQGVLRPRQQVLVIERIVVTHRVKLAPEHHEAARRAHEFYHRGCPVSQSIGAAIDIDSILEFS
jgi:uncharacterized OsmC-like protein